MALKRPRDVVDSSSANKNHKKLKTQAARTIQVQPESLGASNKNAPQVSSASQPRKVNFKENSMQGLPSMVDIGKFAEARQFEINAMQSSMVTARMSATKRVWQTLPRHLRRRAASHDVTRVPVRLREKAKAEMDPAQKKKKIRAISKRGKTKAISRTESLLKRQRDKTWLETHIWHAKRMKMENLWGHRLAVKPTEKSFRPSHRAAVHSSIINDISYFSTIELRGREDLIVKILHRCCDPLVAVDSQRFVSGARLCETHLYEVDSYPLRLICPISVLWKPMDLEQPTNTSERSCIRTVWIRSHPAEFEATHQALCQSISLVLEKERETQTQTQPGPESSSKAAPSEGGISQNPEDLQVEIADLRGDLNAFEIIGPRSSQVIAGAFKLVKETSPNSKKFWKSLTPLRSPGSVPRGMVIGLKLHDPRLSFPPSNAKADKGEGVQHQPGGQPVFKITPSPDLAQNSLWDPSVREELQKPKFKKKDLDERRSKNLVPGKQLQPLQQDDRIPIILIQRTISALNGPPSKTTGTPALHGWTILLPAGWAMPFWSSLTYTGTRVGGLRERATQHFEASSPHFPNDYAVTAAYNQLWSEREEDEKDKWTRTPKGKRVNYDGLGIRSPWRADWEVVLGLVPDGVLATAAPQADQNLISTQRDEPGDTTLAQDITDASLRPWLLRGLLAAHLFKQLGSDPAGELSWLDILEERLSSLRVHKRVSALTTSKEELGRSALVTVRVIPCGRGAPGDLAAIYAVPKDEEIRWRNALEKKGKSTIELEEESESGENLCKIVPESDNVIGYVTTGHFSLQLGQGYAIGCVSASKFAEIVQRCVSSKWNKYFVKIRDRNSSFCRPAWVELNTR